MAAEYKRSFSKRVWDAEEQAADLEKSLDDSSRYLRVVYDSEGASSSSSALRSRTPGDEWIWTNSACIAVSK